jgi:hypothetical protein
LAKTRICSFPYYVGQPFFLNLTSFPWTEQSEWKIALRRSRSQISSGGVVNSGNPASLAVSFKTRNEGQVKHRTGAGHRPKVAGRTWLTRTQGSPYVFKYPVPGRLRRLSRSALLVRASPLARAFYEHEVLSRPPGKNQVKVAMETPGRLLGTTWSLDADAFVQ